ncbi:MAG: outer membrane protein [Parvibaculaceae bacterium]
MIYSKILSAGTILAAVTLPTVGQAADIVAPEPVADVWSGFYVGAYAGYTWLDIGGTYEGDDTDDDGPVDGGLYGGQIGYNYQLDGWVLGLEADIAYSDAKGELVTDDGEEAPTDMDWLATVRARAGITFGEDDRALLFATGGLAIAEFDSDFEGQSDGATHLGGVVGGGLEYLLTESVSLKAEYNYVFFEEKDYDDNEGEKIDYDGHIAKIGVNFHF